jgi:splicing factor 3B subunit 5
MRPCSEWLTHQHRDTLSSIVGHPSLTSYLAIADGEATGRIKFEMTEVPLQYWYRAIC